MTHAKGKPHPADHWQKARQAAAELSLALPNPAPGTVIYLCSDGIDHPTLILLRALVRAAERDGCRLKIL